MKWRVDFLIANTPQGEKNAPRSVVVTDSREDRDWTYFECEGGATLGIPTHWITNIEEIDV
jgi:hypothetical protein